MNKKTDISDSSQLQKISLAPEHLYVIIPAAGQGRRMGDKANKQTLPIGGIPVIVRTLLAFERYSYEKRQKQKKFQLHLVLVTGHELIKESQILCEEYKLSCVEKIVVGGRSRQDSVWEGIVTLGELERPPHAQDVVFVHDGARCFVDSKVLDNCLSGALNYEACAAAVPVKDTIKEILSQEVPKVTRTPERSKLYAIQTPQAFLYHVLLAAYTFGNQNNIQATDDTSLAEAMGLSVYLTEGSYMNIKITTPEDLLLAELLEKTQKES